MWNASAGEAPASYVATRSKGISHFDTNSPVQPVFIQGDDHRNNKDKLILVTDVQSCLGTRQNFTQQGTPSFQKPALC